MKFCIVGFASVVMNYLVFFILLSLFSVNYLISAVTGSLSGIFLGFGFNRKFTFKSQKTIKKALPPYLMVYFVSLLFQIISLRILVESGLLAPITANIILLPFIIFINFFGTKLLSFQNYQW